MVKNLANNNNNNICCESMNSRHSTTPLTSDHNGDIIENVNLQNDINTPATLSHWTTTANTESLPSIQQYEMIPLRFPSDTPNEDAVLHDHNDGHRTQCWTLSSRLIFLTAVTISILANLVPVLMECRSLRTAYEALSSKNEWYSLTSQYGDIIVLAPPKVKPRWIDATKGGLPSTLLEETLSLRKVDASPYDFSDFDTINNKSTRPNNNNNNMGHWGLDFILEGTNPKNKTALPSIQCNLMNTMMRRKNLPVTTAWPIKFETPITPSNTLKGGLLVFIMLRWCLPVARFLQFVSKGQTEKWNVLAIQLFIYISSCSMSLALIGTEIHQNGCIEWWAWGSIGYRLFQWQPMFWTVNIAAVSFFCFLWIVVHAVRRSTLYAATVRSGELLDPEVLDETNNTSSRVPRIARFFLRSVYGSTSPNEVYSANEARNLSATWRPELPLPNELRQQLRRSFCTELCENIYDPLLPATILFFFATSFLGSASVLIIGMHKPWIASIWSFVALAFLEAVIRRCLDLPIAEDHLNVAFDDRDEVTPPYLSLRAAELHWPGKGKFDAFEGAELAYFQPPEDGSPVFRHFTASNDDIPIVCYDDDSQAKDAHMHHLTCVVCWDQYASVIADPCGHAVLCPTCCEMILAKAVHKYNRQCDRYLVALRTRVRYPPLVPKLENLVHCPLCRMRINKFFKFHSENETQSKNKRAICAWNASMLQSCTFTNDDHRHKNPWYSSWCRCP